MSASLYTIPDAVTSLDSNKQIAKILTGMPKAELHIHIEGSLEPELIFKLSERNKIPLNYASVEELRAAYAFTDLQSFLDIYYAGASVLIHEEDFYDMAMAYFKRCQEDNVIRTEVFFDPQTHTERGIAMRTVIYGLSRACADAKKLYNVSAVLILSFLRHLSEAAAFATLEEALPYREHYIGIGLDSSEVGNPPEKFKNVFAKCKELGFRLVAHAGEEGPPSYIWGALNDLHVERIDHGVQSEKDEKLMAHLKASRMSLTVCPLSNLKLCVFSELSLHNLPKLLAEGLNVTVNSDDPAYFGGYMNENFLQLFKATNMGVVEAYKLARNSLESTFASEAEKTEWVGQLDAFFGKLAEEQQLANAY